MNIKSIKNRANTVLMPYRNQFIRVLLIMVILAAIPSLFTASNPVVSLISFILNIVFLPITHGIIVSSLKIVRNMGHTVEDYDAFAGLKRFKELFSTYLAQWAFVFIAMFLFIFVIGVIIAAVIGETILSIASLTNPTVDTIITMLVANPSMIITILLISLLSLVFVLLLEAYTFAVPYLLEQYHFKGMTAIKTSLSMMKGHILDYIKLYFSFFGWVFLSALIEGLLSSFISYALVVTILVSLFQIYTYMPLYHMSQAVLFEEIAFYHFNQVGEDVEV